MTPDPETNGATVTPEQEAREAADRAARAQAPVTIEAIESTIRRLDAIVRRMDVLEARIAALEVPAHE
jgi:hypothetical protein